MIKMSENRDIDLYTQIYRCTESIYNLIIRARMKKVTSTSVAVEFQERDCEIEERDFKWQERVFSRSEVSFYKNANNCMTANDREIHELVKNVDQQSLKWLFSFSSLPSGEYQNVVEKSVFANNFCIKNFVPKAPLNKYGRGLSRTVHKKNIVDYAPVKHSEQRKCDKDNGLQVMYILADLDDNSVSTENVVLCSIHWDPVRKIIKVFPDFQNPDISMPGYTVVPHKDSRFSYVYWIYQVLPESEKMPILKIPQNPVVPLRDEFATPRQGYLDVHCFGEINKAFGFDSQKLFVSYMFEITSGIIHWPKFLLEVRSVDWWGCSRVEGYGVLSIPFYPGHHVFTVPMWKPAPGSVKDNLHYFFTGITPQLVDPLYPGITSTKQEKPFLSKYGFTTVATGNVLLNLNIVHHCKIPVKDISFRKNSEFILERLSASTLLNSVNRVVKAFKEARKQIQDISN